MRARSRAAPFLNGSQTILVYSLLIVGPVRSNSEGLKFIMNKFVSQAIRKNSLKTHLTCATDTKSFGIIMTKVVESVSVDNLRNLGVIN